MPKSALDCGSGAILAHMQSLRRLGYEVTFVPADQLALHGAEAAALTATGVTPLGPPLYGSVEELMRRQANTFDLVYLHRISNASKYLALARHYFPKTRLIYCVADLHHVRYARQATAQDRPELTALANWVRLLEGMATAQAHATMTHSPFEAELLRKVVRGANIHVVPWTPSSRPTAVPFPQRRGVALIGPFDNDPNQEAARRLIGEIMPLVRQRSPESECFLVGREMPEWLLQLCKDRIVAVRETDKVAHIFDQVRVTVAPQSYAATIIGNKVIESLAAGVPCVCTPEAAEGLDLPEVLRPCVVDGADAMAQMICGLYDQRTINQECRTAGIEFVEACFTAERLDQALRKVVEG